MDTNLANIFSNSKCIFQQSHNFAKKVEEVEALEVQSSSKHFITIRRRRF